MHLYIEYIYIYKYTVNPENKLLESISATPSTLTLGGPSTSTNDGTVGHHIWRNQLRAHLFQKLHGC